MFDARPQFQDAPLAHGFTAYDCDIVSSEMPCGASWLANCLLELDVALWKPWGADLHADWRQRGGRRYRYDRADESWRRLLPSLRHGREFDFRAAPVPRLSHAWPATFADTPRTILFVRDPRDALYSFWQRARRVGLAPPEQTFAAFIAEPWFHYPLSRADFLAVWLRCWRLALAEREHLVLRYEDYRHDALATLQRAATFLGIGADAGQLARAAAASDFTVAQAAERQLIDAGIVNAQFNRAGEAGEWRRTYDAAMHAAVGRRYDDLDDWLGYAPGQADGESAACCDVEAVLVAAQADQWPRERAGRLKRWLDVAMTSAGGG